MRKEILRAERISYKKQDVMLLDGLNLNVFEGEIVGLVPVNSYGVEALMEVLCYNRPLYYGFVYYNERLINSWRHEGQGSSPISLIQNRSSLAPDLTVLENLFVLGSEYKARLIHYKNLREYFGILTQKLNVSMDADAYVDSLSTYERVVAELIKAIISGSRLVIMWDVSTFVGARELRKLHRLMERCTREGMSFLYITPHLEETAQLCDRTLSMYNGQILKCMERGSPWPDIFPLPANRRYFELVRNQISKQKPPDYGEAPVLELRKISTAALSGLSLRVQKGECLVIQDMDDSVSSELLAVLQRDTRYSGEIMVEGKPRRGSRSIAVIQELATRTMLFPQLSYLDNLCFTLDHKFPRIWSDPGLRRGIRRDMAQYVGSEVFDKSIFELTENEKYDLIYTRVLMQHPAAVFCIRPFKGAEMESRMHICLLLERLLEADIAVVILAVNLGDALALADRVLQIREGRITKEYLPEDFPSLPDSTPWRRLYENFANVHLKQKKTKN